MVDDCPVCLEELAEAVVSSCGHTFCRTCVLGVLRAHRPAWRAQCPLCRRRLSAYSTVGRDTGKPLLQRVNSPPGAWSISGHIYTQGGVCGLAAYHFSDESSSYISYESELCMRWPPLDNGSRAPARKFFQQAAYDEATRTFTGVIDWSPTSWQGDQRWIYCIVFADDFMSIIGGELKNFRPGGNREESIQVFDESDQSDREGCLVYARFLPAAGIVGETYVQRGLFGFATYHFVSETEAFIHYDAEVCRGFYPLDNGAQMPRQKDFHFTQYDSETRTFSGTIFWSPSCMGDQRWEFTLVFSEDFETICGGEMIRFPVSFPDEEFPPRLPFGVPPLLYKRWHPEVAKILLTDNGAAEETVGAFNFPAQR